MKNNNNDERPAKAPEMLELIEEGNFRAKTIDAKVVSAYQISQMIKSGWKYIKTDFEDEIVRCYFIRK